MSDLSELFARDPLNMTDDDITLIVVRERASQAQHELGLKPAPKKEPKVGGGAKDLKDLGLS